MSPTRHASPTSSRSSSASPSKSRRTPTKTAPPARPKRNGLERPHPHVRFELISIDRLLPHEEIEEAAFRKVLREVQARKQVLEPILVADEHFVVLNGHHRLAALKALGVKRVPAWVVAYFTDVVSLEPWPNTTHQLPVTKEHVLSRARDARLYPPKSTRHKLKVDLPERSTPLDELR